MNQQLNNNGRSIAAVLADIKEDLKPFVQTRIELLKTELHDKIKTLKVAAPLAAVGVLLLATAYLLLTMSLVALLYAVLPDSPYRWCLAFLAVGVFWFIVGAVAGYFAKREFELKGLMPNKTIAVLRGDKAWIQAEVKNQV